MRGRFIQFICCLAVVVVFGCSEKDSVTQPERQSDLILEGDPIDVVYITDGDSVTENYSDTFTTGWDDLGWHEYYYAYGNMWMGDERAVTEELVAGEDGTITVIITDCPTGHTWSMYYSDPADLHLSGIDSVGTAPALYDVSYRYKIHRPGKGYIAFREMTPEGYGARSKGFGIVYTCGFIETLRVDIGSITWHYRILENWSELDVSIEGETNAYKILIETYGDGNIGISEIPLDDKGIFSGKFSVSFCYGCKSYMGTGSRLYVIGTVGLPKVINLPNPLEASGN